MPGSFSFLRYGDMRRQIGFEIRDMWYNLGKYPKHVLPSVFPKNNSEGCSWKNAVLLDGTWSNLLCGRCPME